MIATLPAAVADTAFAASPLAIVEVDGEARLRRWNAAAGALLDLHPHDTGRRFGAVAGCRMAVHGGCGGSPTCAGCPVRARIRRALVDGGSACDEIRLDRTPGDAWWTVAAARVDGDPPTVLLFLEDSGARRAEAQRLNALAAGGAEALGLGELEHALRTPLNAILGYAQLLHREHGHAAGPTAERLAGILAAGQNLLRLIGAFVARGRGAGHGPAVLVVDDDPACRELLAEALAEAGFTVETAADSRVALAIAAQRAPKAAFVDLHLPDVDGRILAERLRRLQGLAELPVIAITGDADATAAGCVAVLRKPYRLDDAIAVVREATSPPASGPELGIGSLASLPELLRERLIEAAIAARRDRLESFIPEIVRHLPQHAEAFRAALAAFRYDRLLAAAVVPA